MKKGFPLLSYFLITIGCIVMALGINMFLLPNKIAPGGLTGISTVLYHLFHLPVGVMMLLMNIPLFAVGIKLLGAHFGVKTFYATLLLSLIIDVTAFLPVLTDDLFLATVSGGVLLGIGLGIILRQNATTGGTDLGAMILHKIFPFFSISQILLVIDIIVVVLASMVFKNYELGLYAAVSLFVTARIIDFIVAGINYSKATTIISKNPDAIVKRILNELDRGVTGLKGRGLYTGESKEVLLCVLPPREIPQLKKIVKEIDPDAFIFMSDVREVLGEGFSSLSEHQC